MTEGCLEYAWVRLKLNQECGCLRVTANDGVPHGRATSVQLD